MRESDVVDSVVPVGVSAVEAEADVAVSDSAVAAVADVEGKAVGFTSLVDVVVTVVLEVVDRGWLSSSSDGSIKSVPPSSDGSSSGLGGRLSSEETSEEPSGDISPDSEGESAEMSGYYTVSCDTAAEVGVLLPMR